MAYDLKKLKKLCESSRLAKGTFQVLASRDRNREIVDLYRLRNEVSEHLKEVIATGDMLSLAKAWASLGLGAFIAQQSRGASPRFAWKYDYKELAREALGLPPDPEVPVRLSLNESYTFPLASGKTLYIPRDITRDDVTELQSFLNRILAISR